MESTCPRCGYCNEPSPHSQSECGAWHDEDVKPSDGDSFDDAQWDNDHYGGEG